MEINTQHEHVIRRLRIVHAGGLAVVTLFFFMFFFLGEKSDINTSLTQMTLLAMAFVLGLGYLSVIISRKEIPYTPLIFFFVLNLLTTMLVWTTGTFRSPFVGLYIILILATSQLYRYLYGLVQTVLAFCGLVFIYTATTNSLLPYRSILPTADISTYYQPTIVILIYGLIYGMLFLLTVLSSSNARIILYRPTKRTDLDSTYQEHIIQTMPLGIFIVDNTLHILGNNPAAAAQFPTSNTSNVLTDYLSLSKVHPRQTLLRLAQSKEERQLLWKLDTGELRPITISVDLQKSNNHDDDTIILFVK